MANVKYTTYVTDIVLADIVGFSKLPTESQLAVANVITAGLRKVAGLLSAGSFRAESELIVGFVPTGDGFYVVLHPEVAGYGIFLAMSLRSSMLLDNQKMGNLHAGIRIGVHLGEAASFEDVCGKTNFVGDGMNECARLLGAKRAESPTPGIPPDENYVVASTAALEQFHLLFPGTPEMAEFLSAIKFSTSTEFPITDKHGRTHAARFVECSRHVAVNPPHPDDIEERLCKIRQRVSADANAT